MRTEIAKAAEVMFIERGFEATTIEDIASAAGMSPRSVFRYFAVKEEIVLGKFDGIMEERLAVLHERPAREPVWTSLHRMFGVLVGGTQAPGREQVAEEVHRMVFQTPALFAAYLQKLQYLQDAVVTELLSRAEQAGKPYAMDDPTPRAVTAAAFGCLMAAHHAWLASGAEASFADAVDRAMATVGPRA
ncbi:TetR family transcriptional regulator [Amycolatopsis pithecellobii]|uniref:TetR family transcriptional regulator n=1 Tax=Amycolatopsis pithecellobii TaxID=664692 RepID=A0A6N7Z256_9PSEU|nr:TetR family transcriptional regulator [Amycolatopsis pithecellobii]MTD53910.1 TetR family transcriptional regulator [Amycolatopsis pithecellobii]